MNYLTVLLTLAAATPAHGYQHGVVVIDRQNEIVIGSTECILVESPDDAYKLPSSMAICIPSTIAVAELTATLEPFGKPTTSVIVEDGYHRVEYPTCNLLERDGGMYLYDCMYARPRVPLE